MRETVFHKAGTKARLGSIAADPPAAYALDGRAGEQEVAPQPGQPLPSFWFTDDEREDGS